MKLSIQKVGNVSQTLIQPLWVNLQMKSMQRALEFIVPGLHIYTCAWDNSTLNWGGASLAGKGLGESACHPGAAPPRLDMLQKGWLRSEAATEWG